MVSKTQSSKLRISVRYRFKLLLVLRYGHPAFSEVLLITQADDPRPNPKIEQNRKNFYKLFGKAVRELVVQRDIRYFSAFDSSADTKYYFSVIYIRQADTLKANGS